MPSTTTGNHSPLALTYAQALIELAGDRAADIGQDLDGIAEVLEASPAFALYLADPAIGHIERTQTLERIFKGKVDDLVWKFIGTMNNKGRAGHLPEVIAAYRELLDHKLGKVEVDLTVAQPLTDDQLARAQQLISTALDKEAVVHQHVNDAIIGGVVLRVGDQLIDASVRNQLAAVRHKLLSKMPK